jgi:hypothetical protein
MLPRFAAVAKLLRPVSMKFGVEVKRTGFMARRFLSAACVTT